MTAPRMSTRHCRRAEGVPAAPCTCGMCEGARDPLAEARETLEALRSTERLLTGLPWSIDGRRVIGPRGGLLATFAREHDAEAVIGMRMAMADLIDLAAAGLALVEAVEDADGIWDGDDAMDAARIACHAYRATLARVTEATVVDGEADHA